MSNHMYTLYKELNAATKSLLKMAGCDFGVSSVEVEVCSVLPVVRLLLLFGGASA